MALLICCSSAAAFSPSPIAPPTSSSAWRSDQLQRRAALERLFGPTRVRRSDHATALASQAVLYHVLNRKRPQYDPNELPEHPTLPFLSSVPELWEVLASQYGERTLLVDPYHEPPTNLTFTQTRDMVNNLAGALQQLGLDKGDKVMLLAEDSHRWLVASQAIMKAGGASVPRGLTSPPDEQKYVFEHSDSVGLVAETAEDAKALLGRLGAGGALERLKFIVVLEGSGYLMAGMTPAYQFDKLANTRSPSFDPPSVSPEDIATIMYTSGTAGIPKGVMLTHGNLLHQIYAITVDDHNRTPPYLTKRRGWRALFRRGPRSDNPRSGEILLSILPPWHIYSKALQLWMLARGVEMHYTDRRHFVEDLVRVRPHHMALVPRLIQAIQQSVERKLNESKGIKRRLIKALRWASTEPPPTYLRSGSEADEEPTGSARSVVLVWKAFLRLLAYPLLWNKLRRRLAPRLRIVTSGGAALSLQTEDTARLLGFPLVQGYGLTETSPVVVVGSLKTRRRGAIGPIVACTEMRAVDERGVEVPTGEIGRVQFRGPQVMHGYYQDEPATKRAIDDGGFLDTGDLGRILPDGSLLFVGRAKDTIVLSNGKNVYAEDIEKQCLTSPLVEQILLSGQDEKFLGALVVPNVEGLEADDLITPDEGDRIRLMREQRDAEGLRQMAMDLQSRPAFNEVMMQHLNADDARPDHERVKSFRVVLEPFTVDNLQLTPTFKTKRHVISEQYASLLDEMYSTTGTDHLLLPSASIDRHHTAATHDTHHHTADTADDQSEAEAGNVVAEPAVVQSSRAAWNSIA
mmetsp:Transcript_29486/g.85308  ORF Transcript_29486/g.85308 Transcript_29486/m.85308 type:complete len:801 (-) Transcript_29486:102-2504(-)